MLFQKEQYFGSVCSRWLCFHCDLLSVKSGTFWQKVTRQHIYNSEKKDILRFNGALEWSVLYCYGMQVVYDAGPSGGHIYSLSVHFNLSVTTRPGSVNNRGLGNLLINVLVEKLQKHIIHIRPWQIKLRCTFLSMPWVPPPRYVTVYCPLQEKGKKYMFWGYLSINFFLRAYLWLMNVNIIFFYSVNYLQYFTSALNAITVITMTIQSASDQQSRCNDYTEKSQSTSYCVQFT